MRFKTLVSFSASMMLAGPVALAGGKAAPGVEPAARAAAARTFKELGGQAGTRLAGMPAPDQMGKAALGEPFAVMMVQLDELQAYEPGSDPGALLHDLQTVVYPIRVAGKLNGEMVLSKADGSWSPRSFAGPGHVQAMEDVRGQVTAATGAPAGSTMLVRVPALYIEFIAYRDAAGLQLTPIADLEAVGLKAGQTLPASRAFELLAPLAQQYKDMGN